MSDPRLSVLAARIRANLGPPGGPSPEEEQAQGAAAAWGRGARDRLFSELALLGRAAGWLRVEQGAGGVVYRLGRRALRFEVWGSQGAVRVRGTGLMTSCFRLVPSELGWDLEVTDRDLRRHRFPLFDEGLVLLLQRALRLSLRPVEPAAEALQG